MLGEVEDGSELVLLEEDDGLWLPELDEELDRLEEVEESVVSEVEPEVDEPVVPRDD